jgi:hypothetical protein
MNNLEVLARKTISPSLWQSAHNRGNFIRLQPSATTPRKLFPAKIRRQRAMFRETPSRRKCPLLQERERSEVNDTASRRHHRRFVSHQDDDVVATAHPSQPSLLRAWGESEIPRHSDLSLAGKRVTGRWLQLFAPAALNMFWIRRLTKDSRKVRIRDGVGRVRSITIKENFAMVRGNFVGVSDFDSVTRGN